MEICSKSLVMPIDISKNVFINSSHYSAFHELLSTTQEKRLEPCVKSIRVIHFSFVCEQITFI